jgi:hypothetical protein
MNRALGGSPWQMTTHNIDTINFLVRRGDTGGAIDLLYPMAAVLYLLSGVCRLVLRWWSDRA